LWQIAIITNRGAPLWQIVAEPGFVSVSLREEDVKLARRIAATFEIEASTAAVVRAALNAYAKELGVEA
jgi:hypothetical protein